MEKHNFSKLKFGFIGIGVAICISVHSLMAIYFFDGMGLISGFIILSIVSFRKGAEIDFKSNQIRKYNSIYGLKFGSWNPINPKFSFRSIVDNKRYKFNYKSSSVTREKKPGMVVYEGSKGTGRIILGEFDEKQQADRFAKELRDRIY